MTYGLSCSPKQTSPPIVQTNVIKQDNPKVFLEKYQSPPEPEEHTMQSLVKYILDQRAVIEKHNADKEALIHTSTSP